MLYLAQNLIPVIERDYCQQRWSVGMGSDG